MYNEITAEVNSIIEICNGKIHFDAIDPISKAIGCDITTPWNTGSYVGFYEGEECALYKKMEGIGVQFIKYEYLIKVTNIDFINKKATFKVLSYADESNYDLKITETSLPTKVKPGDIINFKYNIKNQSNNNVTVRFILGVSSIGYPKQMASDYDDCDKVIPPATMLDVYKHCWYDDWITLPQQCNEKTLSISSSYDIIGSFIAPSVDKIYIRLCAFVYKDNYWSANKNEWVWSKSDGAYIEVDKCLYVSCPNKCYNFDLWSEKCDPLTGLCVKDALIEKNSSSCSHLECVNNICTRLPNAGTDTCTPEGSVCDGEGEYTKTIELYFKAPSLVPVSIISSMLNDIY